MANLYGPMQYRPNPSGITLNSQPRPQFQPPVAAPQPAMPSVMSFADWSQQNPMRRRFTPGDRGSRTPDGAYGVAGMAMRNQQNAYDKYRLDALTGQSSPGFGMGRGAPAPVQGMLGLDPTAAAFASFLNGGV